MWGSLSPVQRQRAELRVKDAMCWGVQRFLGLPLLCSSPGPFLGASVCLCVGWGQSLRCCPVDFTAFPHVKAQSPPGSFSDPQHLQLGCSCYELFIPYCSWLSKQAGAEPALSILLYHRRLVGAGPGILNSWSAISLRQTQPYLVGSPGLQGQP